MDTIALALDTGASHTTFDLTQILMLGYSVTDAIRMERVKTGGGTVETYVFVLKQLTCLGITRTNIEVSAYDFFAFNIVADFDGVLGLDFFEDVKFCIDLKQKEINIQ
ncbi:MAG: retropepsin-like domain-containing protein [Sphingobacteriales bacterium]|nr:retropepsin-like domain-containing protein [Sphingobacteriales bacterium]